MSATAAATMRARRLRTRSFAHTARKSNPPSVACTDASVVCNVIDRRKIESCNERK
jgi:hypothetical protein